MPVPERLELMRAAVKRPSSVTEPLTLEEVITIVQGMAREHQALIRAQEVAIALAHAQKMAEGFEARQRQAQEGITAAQAQQRAVEEAHQHRLQQLTEDIAEAKQQYEHVKQQCEAGEAALLEQHAAQGVWEARQQEIERQLEAKRAIVHELESRGGVLQQAIAEAGNRVAALQGEAERAEQRVEDARERFEAVRQQLARLHVEVGILTQEDP